MSEQVKASNDKNSKDNISLKKLIYKADFAAIIIVGLSTVMLLLIIAKAVWSNSDNPAYNQIEIKYILKVDSSQLKSFKDSTSISYDKFIKENNQKVIDEVNNSISKQYQWMQSILGVQEDKGKLFTYGAGFLAILVALATFFGFKSINEMKKGTIDSAEYEAKKVAEEIAKKVAEEIAKKVAEEKTKEEIQARYETIEKTIFEKVKADLLADIHKNALTMKDIDSKLAKLEERLDVYLASKEMVGNSSEKEAEPADEVGETTAKNDETSKKDLFSDEDTNNK